MTEIAMSCADAALPLQWWGDQGQWLVCDGHVDLQVFTAAADAEYRRQYGSVEFPVADDEVPSASFVAEHVWFRTLTRPWFDRNNRRYTHDQADTMFAALVADGGLEPCTRACPGARAFTWIRTGT